jgi:glycine/serine hydroxymethyltransferase
MKEEEMGLIASLIARVLRDRSDQDTIVAVRSEVATLCAKFPAYS